MHFEFVEHAVRTQMDQPDDRIASADVADASRGLTTREPERKTHLREGLGRSG